MIQKLLVALATVLLTLLVAAPAEALTYRKITDEEIKAMTTRILAVGAASNEKEEMKDLLDMARRVRPIVELVEAKCPMPVKVANGTNIPVFNVEVSVSERRGQSGVRVPQTLHIPYIPAKSVVTGTIACAVPSTSYGYQPYGERDIYMSASPIAEHSRLDEDGIKKILRTNQDVTTETMGFTSFATTSAQSRLGALGGILGRDAGAPSYDPRKPSILSAILTQLAQDDEHPADFTFLVAGLLRTEAGAGALGAWFRTATEGYGPVTALISSAQPGKVRAMVEEIMKGRSPYGTAGTNLVTTAVTRVCGPGQPEAERTSMWLAALGKDVISENIRATVLEKCGVGKEQTRARLKAAKPEQLGRALDGMTGDLFGIAVAAMTESKSFGAASTLLAATQDSDKFDAVSKAALGFVTAVQREQLVRNVAEGTGGTLDETKAKWVRAQLDELHGRAADAPVLKQLLGDMADGLVHNRDIRKTVYARWKDAGKDAFAPFMTAIAARPHILAPAWIQAQAEAGKLDLYELLTKLNGGVAVVAEGKPTLDDSSDEDDTEGSPSSSIATRMPTKTKTSNTCLVDAKSASECFNTVQTLPLTKDAIDPKTVAAVLGFLKTASYDETPARLAVQLSEVGVDMSGAADALCQSAAKTPGRWGYSSGYGDTLNTAEKLAPSHPCIANVRAARVSAERWIAAGIGLRLMLALVPFGFVALIAKKKFVPVRAQLAKENAELELVRSRSAVSLRLARPQTEETLGAGITDAARFLTGEAHAEVAAAGRALQALPPAILVQARSLAQRAAETGEASTMLAELEGVVLYVACFPGREDQPQTVRRHAGFTDGWQPHIARIVAACVADGRPSKVLSLVFMLGATGAKSTLLVGYDTPSFHFVPDALASAGNDGTHDHRYELALGEG